MPALMLRKSILHLSFIATLLDYERIPGSLELFSGFWFLMVEVLGNRRH